MSVVNSELFCCSSCKAEFQKKICLRNHEKHFHKKNNIKVTRKLFKCENCDKMFPSKWSRKLHQTRIHDKRKCIPEIADTNLRFNSQQDFHDWLVSEEHQIKVHFEMARKEIKKEKYLILEYKCKRRGECVFKSNAKHQLKTSERIKLGKKCNASLIVKVFKTHVEAVYYKEHNHDLLGHLQSSTAAKNLSESLNCLRHENGSLKASDRPLSEKKLLQLDDELCLLHKQKGELTEEVICLKNKLEEREKEILAKNERILELEKSMKPTKQHLKSLQQKIHEMDRKLQESLASSAIANSATTSSNDKTDVSELDIKPDVSELDIKPDVSEIRASFSPKINEVNSLTSLTTTTAEIPSTATISPKSPMIFRTANTVNSATVPGTYSIDRPTVSTLGGKIVGSSVAQNPAAPAAPIPTQIQLMQGPNGEFQARGQTVQLIQGPSGELQVTGLSPGQHLVRLSNGQMNIFTLPTSQQAQPTVQPQPQPAVQPHPQPAVQPHPQPAVQSHPQLAIKPKPQLAILPKPQLAVLPRPQQLALYPAISSAPATTESMVRWQYPTGFADPNCLIKVVLNV